MHEQVHASVHACWHFMLQISCTYTCILKLLQEPVSNIENRSFRTFACMHEQVHANVHAHGQFMMQISWTYTCNWKLKQETENYKRKWKFDKTSCEQQEQEQEQEQQQQQRRRIWNNAAQGKKGEKETSLWMCPLTDGVYKKRDAKKIWKRCSKMSHFSATPKKKNLSFSKVFPWTWYKI